VVKGCIDAMRYRFLAQRATLRAAVDLPNAEPTAKNANRANKARFTKPRLYQPVRS
jgi:hypothetical protein